MEPSVGWYVVEGDPMLVLESGMCSVDAEPYVISVYQR